MELLTVLQGYHPWPLTGAELAAQLQCRAGIRTSETAVRSTIQGLRRVLVLLPAPGPAPPRLLRNEGRGYFLVLDARNAPAGRRIRRPENSA